MISVLLTGATGFIGHRLSIVLPNDFNLRLVFRNTPVIPPSSDFVICDYNNVSTLSTALKNIDVVVHCVGRAHLLNQNNNHQIEEFRKVNVEITIRLAHAAAKAGVKRFIFLSSIGVNGRLTTKPFTEDDTPLPEQDYAVSKLEAEIALQEIALSSGMEVVIVRPPLVYGPGAPGNFAKLIKWLNRNIPLPFGAIYNKRSFIALDNLVDFIITCIRHPAAANQVFLVSDNIDLSTTEFLNRISSSLGKSSRLYPVNQKILELCLRLLGKKDLAQRLCGSLQIDISKAKKLLNWTPPVSIDTQLKETAEHFLKSQSL